MTARWFASRAQVFAAGVFLQAAAGFMDRKDYAWAGMFFFCVITYLVGDWAEFRRDRVDAK